ncbi:MAG: hypothetical protein LBT90_00230 [Holosporaceae bacterium]|nr:hypothetical protein [Holosporaceae bacterium]
MLSLNFQFTNVVKETIDFLWKHIVKTSIAANLIYSLARKAKKHINKKL